LVLATSGVWHQLQSSHLSVIQGLKIFFNPWRGDIHPCPPSMATPLCTLNLHHIESHRIVGRRTGLSNFTAASTCDFHCGSTTFELNCRKKSRLNNGVQYNYRYKKAVLSQGEPRDDDVNFGTILKFTAASRGPPCDSTAFELNNRKNDG